MLRITFFLKFHWLTLGLTCKARGLAQATVWNFFPKILPACEFAHPASIQSRIPDVSSLIIRNFALRNIRPINLTYSVRTTSMEKGHLVG